MIRYRPQKPELRGFVRSRWSLEPMAPEEFKRIRKAARMTQAQMAAYLDVSRITINNWEGGKFRIPDDALDKMAEKGLLTPVKAKPYTSKFLAAYRNGRASPLNMDHATCWREIILAARRYGDPMPTADDIAAILAEWPDIVP